MPTSQDAARDSTTTHPRALFPNSRRRPVVPAGWIGCSLECECKCKFDLDSVCERECERECIVCICCVCQPFARCLRVTGVSSRRRDTRARMLTPLTACSVTFMLGSERERGVAGARVYENRENSFLQAGRATVAPQASYAPQPAKIHLACFRRLKGPVSGLGATLVCAAGDIFAGWVGAGPENFRRLELQGPISLQPPFAMRKPSEASDVLDAGGGTGAQGAGQSGQRGCICSD